MHVVATAGHVDHGKSTLVQALTGRHPDRLEEERERGLSIELGYCWTELDGLGEVAFVDVPGHQRFIATTLAGMGPVPVAMLVVAADDPWMPQAAEHLAALDALGVQHGVLVVTRSDLADPAPALARARAEVDATSLAGAPHVVVSGRTGHGLAELRATLGSVLREVPSPDPGSDVRLWVDRRFTVRGTGTVVTGTLPAGTIAVGDELEHASGTVRVRGIEALEVPRASVSGVARVALDLGGRSPGLARGATLTTPGAFRSADEVDVELIGDGRLPRSPVLHLGSVLLGVQARPLGEHHARLRLDPPLPLRVGDRGLLRDPGSRALWGVRVLDPMPPGLGRRGAPARRGEALARRDGSLAAELADRGWVRREDLRRIGVPLADEPPGTLSTGGWLLAPDRAEELRGRLVELVAEEHRVTTGAAARRLELPDAALVDALVAPPVTLVNGVLTDGESLAPWLVDALHEVRAALAESPFTPLDRTQMRELGLDAAACAALARQGHVLRLDDDVLLLPGADDLAVKHLEQLPSPFTTSEARQALGTSRRVALPLLAHLDRAGRTVRFPDDSRRLR